MRQIRVHWPETGKETFETYRPGQHNALDQESYEKAMDALPDTEWRCDTCGAEWAMPGRGGDLPICCAEQHATVFFQPLDAWMTLEEISRTVEFDARNARR